MNTLSCAYCAFYAVRYSLALATALASLTSFPAFAQTQSERGSAAIEEMGRLFLTPAQRQELDRRRLLNIQEVAVSGQDLISVTGQISRSSGKSTTWINGAPQEDVYRNPRDPSRITLSGGEGEPGVEIKVGQTIDKTRGAVTDGLAGGEISIKRPKPHTPDRANRR